MMGLGVANGVFFEFGGTKRLDGFAIWMDCLFGQKRCLGDGFKQSLDGTYLTSYSL